MFLAGFCMLKWGWMVIPSTLWLALDYFTYFFLIWYFLAFLVYLVKGARGVDPAMIGLLLGVGLTARFVGSLILTPAVKRSIKSSLLHCDFLLFISPIYRCIYVGHSLGLALFGNDDRI